ncbi:MAG: GNAT family N-acetyltransferase [Proteobacteria bacterium]|nr:GNAT family N-acetyltransferase [Pseudomonadota bacterium]
MKLELQTERLLLTPFALTDLDLALEMWTDPEVAKYVGGVMTEAEIRQQMSDVTKRGGNGGIGIWCIADRRTGEKLGDSHLLPLPIDEEDTDFSLVVMGQMPDAEIEIGFFFKPSAWGRGYATEVCWRLLQFAFQDVSLNEVVSSVDEDNVASKKVLEKCGLLDRGRTRCYGKDSPIYRITRDEWNELQPSINVGEI